MGDGGMNCQNAITADTDWEISLAVPTEAALIMIEQFISHPPSALRHPVQKNVDHRRSES
jgi:hypothetical protein